MRGGLGPVPEGEEWRYIAHLVLFLTLTPLALLGLAYLEAHYGH